MAPDPRAVAQWLWSAWVGLVRYLLDSIYRLPKGTLRAFQRALFGSTDSYKTRIATFVMLGAAAIIGMGVYAAAVSGLQVSSDSSWFVETLLRVSLNLWSYVIAGLLAVSALLLFRERREAALAAEKTGFSLRTVRRLSAEAKSTDGCTTVVISPSDSLLEITNRVLSVFDVDPVTSENEHVARVERYLGTTSDVLDTTPEDTRPGRHTPPEADTIGEQIRLTRLELASSLSFRDLFWRFFVPSAAVFVVLLIIVQIWVAVWVYPILAAAATLVGTAYYQYTSWRRRRRLSALREPEKTPTWSDIAAMVKKVETEDTTAYYAWVAGRCYVDYDAVRLSASVALAAYSHVHDEPVPPLIQQKFARNVKQFVPNLHGYEYNIERPEMMDALGWAVEEDDHDLVPKYRLGDRVIMRDRDRIGGVGYDPIVLGECYRDIVPYALVEEPVDVSSGTGETKTMTAVRVRTSEIPREKAIAEAEFSSKFDPTAEARFPLPEASHDFSI